MCMSASLLEAPVALLMSKSEEMDEYVTIMCLP